MSLFDSCKTLLPVFLAWKGLILILVWLSPGIGYDTSTSLLLRPNHDQLSVLDKLVRWDAIYFVQMSQASRGHVFEQEWAFGKGISTLLGGSNSLRFIAFRGVLLSHVCHFGTAVLVTQISHCVLGADRVRVNILAGILHILSPAGVFLSAPYTEGPFAFLNILGLYMYVLTHTEKAKIASRRPALLLASSVALATATIIRTNGILSGIPFLVDAIIDLRTLVANLLGYCAGRTSLSRLFTTVIAGTLLATGLAIPQYLAYQEYCLPVAKRPWCNNTLPMIFSFVQAKYWGVGFLRYWTLSNLPLFMLATPCLLFVFWSSIEVLLPQNVIHLGNNNKNILLRLAMPQLVLAVLAITNYHVQIITRLSSGYPLWYIWLADHVARGDMWSKYAVRFFVLYALIQTVLFASFLPPA